MIKFLKRLFSSMGKQLNIPFVTNCNFLCIELDNAQSNPTITLTIDGVVKEKYIAGDYIKNIFPQSDGIKLYKGKIHNTIMGTHYVKKL